MLLKPIEINGWELYNEEAEWKRQGLPNDNWRISKLNDKYEVLFTTVIAISSPSFHLITLEWPCSYHAYLQ
jgi:hypothetical protein